MKWILSQWNDIKGNVKYALVLAIGSAIVTGVVALTHGLELWQELTLAAAFSLMFGFSVLITGLHLSRKSHVQQRSECLPPVAQLKLSTEVPQLWVSYKRRDNTQPESLIFAKDGNGAITNIKAGPLVWVAKEVRPINLHSAIGPIRDEKVECRFTAFEQNGTSQIVFELPDLMREMMRKYSPDVQPSIEITYDDFEGRCFRRKFELSIDPFDNIAWEPGPVEGAD